MQFFKRLHIQVEMPISMARLYKRHSRSRNKDRIYKKWFNRFKDEKTQVLVRVGSYSFSKCDYDSSDTIREIPVIGILGDTE